ncbi:hypothetical protein GLOIN_2v1884937 [Rhizophagus irregularis DAOM 181602=DAOM 197198]|nr:hypothetical protein GLOIN_2v1884937 [Rhizophagus irregularis DAOM 181602=DAOM 197198]
MILEYIVKLNIEEIIKNFNFLNTKGNLPIPTIVDLMKSLIKKKEIITAEELFGKLGKEYYDVEIYNSMMDGYIKCVKENKLEKSLYIRNDAKKWTQTEAVFGDIIENGIEPDERGYQGVNLYYAKNNDIGNVFIILIV